MITLEQIAWLKQRFGDQCEEVKVEGDEPLLLDDPSFAYVTRVPHHQLFCVSYRDGAAHGRREHVALCDAGQLLFGLPPSREEPAAALLLSGMAGSHVWRIPAAALLGLVHEPEGRELVERMFDDFTALLISTLPVAPVPTRCQAVTPGEVIADAASAPLKSQSGVVWLGLARPPARYGALEPELEDQSLHWPLSQTAWALVEGQDVAAKSSGELLAADDSAGFARSFHAFVMSVLGKRRVALEQGRLDRDVASLEAERRFVDESLKQLAAVGRGERLAEEHSHGDEFEQACRMITDWLGVPPAFIPTLAGKSLSHMQAALSRVTSVRMRKVLLEKGWEQHDAGALLGFLLEGGEDELHPVALLPAGSGYEVCDSRKDGRERVTAALAERFHPQAYQFYGSLPAQALRPLDILRFAARRANRDLTFVLAVGLALGSLSTLIPVLTGYVFDNLIPGAERGLLLQLTLVLACVYIGQGLFDVARALSLVRLQTRMDASLEAAVWDRLLALPLPFFRRYSAGELALRAAGIGQIREVLAGASLSALFAALYSVWNFGLLFVIDARLALAATVLVIVAAVPVVLATHYGLKQQRKVAEIDGKIGGLLVQLLAGITKLKVSAAENRAFSVWARLFARRRDADLGTDWIQVRVAVFQSAFPLVCSLVLFWMMAGAGDKITTGQFLAFSAAFGMFLGAMLSLIESGLQSLVVVPLYERAKPILTEPPENQGLGQRVELKGNIEVNHVSFRYDPKGPLILDDVSLQVHADEFVALVGPSGSGKSTLLRMLLGFEAPTEGGVFYDGQALSGLDVRVLRQQIGVVMQHSRVMAGDILTNIVGNTGLGIDDAWRAAEQAALAENIRSFPMGMHTVIAQGGGTLSGGQRQRLLIARALAPAPRLLFFDEATSALDNVTQAAVSQSLEGLRVTRIVIAHRLSTIRHADKIFVLEKGRIVQSGRFDDLIAVEGPFKELAKRQMV